MKPKAPIPADIAIILAACAEEGFDGLTEYKFDAHRRWRFDIAFPREKVAFEREGGTWGGASRHTSGKGFRNDCEKYNQASILGWAVIRCTVDMIESGLALKQLLDALERRRKN